MTCFRKIWLSWLRIFVIATGTLTQLLRMRIFWFLGIFALVILGSNLMRLSDALGPETVGEQELVLVKSMGLGIMRLFCTVFAVTATALLLPRDVEDRILYTILTKPVRRLDYLVGKLFGVMLLITLSLLAMDLLFSGLLEWRASVLISEQTALMKNRGFESGQIVSAVQEICRHGLTWNIQLGIGTIWLEALVLSSVALMISTFSTSSLFTILMGFCIYFIGLFQAEARDFWLHQAGSGMSWGQQIFIPAISLLFPDFQLFSLVDSAISSVTIPLWIFGKVAGAALCYGVFYVLISWFSFAKKEF